MKQGVYTRGPRAAATARRLIANTSIAPHVLASTYKYESTRDIVRMQAMEACYCGQVVIEEQEIFYLVKSKWASLYYVVKSNGACSSQDDRVAAACWARVLAYNLQTEVAA